MSDQDPTTESAGPTAIRLAFWNTWLLAPRLWSTGPRVPILRSTFAPDVARRAPLVAAAAQQHFDVVALSECFERSEQEAVAAAWPLATMVAGPQRRRLKFTGSGLATLVGPRAKLVRTASLDFRTGGDLRDSDTFATKGALLTTLDIGSGLPRIDLVSTHLMAGGDLLPIPGAEDEARHHQARMRQVGELVDFVLRERDPANILLVTGDFNVPAEVPELEDRASRYRDLSAALAPLGVRDVWQHHGVGEGPTCTFSGPDDIPVDPDEADAVADSEGPTTGVGERIDYLWLALPDDLSVDVGVGRPRRWAFPGRGVTGGPAGSLSDHLALSVTLTFAGPPRV